MPADSDDEFAKDFSPVADDTVVNEDKFVPSQDEDFRESEPSSSAPPVEVKLLEGFISSVVTQGLSSITSIKDSLETQGSVHRLDPRWLFKFNQVFQGLLFEYGKELLMMRNGVDLNLVNFKKLAV